VSPRIQEVRGHIAESGVRPVRPKLQRRRILPRSIEFSSIH